MSVAQVSYQVFDKSSDLGLIKLIKEKHIQILVNYFTLKNASHSSGLVDLINEDDKGPLVHAIHSHLVRVQWVQGEAARPKSGLSFLLKNPQGRDVSDFIGPAKAGKQRQKHLDPLTWHSLNLFV